MAVSTVNNYEIKNIINSSNDESMLETSLNDDSCLNSNENEVLLYGNKTDPKRLNSNININVINLDATNLNRFEMPSLILNNLSLASRSNSTNSLIINSSTKNTNKLISLISLTNISNYLSRDNVAKINNDEDDEEIFNDAHDSKEMIDLISKKHNASLNNLNEMVASNNKENNENAGYLNNNQNLTINKVGSFVELRFKRISVSNCFSNITNSNNNNYFDGENIHVNSNPNGADLSFTQRTFLNDHHTTNSKNLKKKLNKNRYSYDRATQLPYSTTKLYNSMSRSRSRTSSYSSLTSSSPSSSSSSSSLSSLFINDSSYGASNSKKKTFPLTKKLKISNNINDAPNTENSLYNNSNLSNTFNDISNNNNNNSSNNIIASNSNINSTISSAHSKFKSLHKKFNQKLSRKSSNNNLVGSTNKTRHNLTKKKSKRNKFSKLNEEHLSKSYVASSLSNFSLANSATDLRRLKCLFVGDSHIGKTALMYLFIKRIFQTEYQPTIVDDYEGNSFYLYAFI